MSNLNKAQIIGRLGDNPDVRYMPNGDAVANLSVATSEKWKDQQGVMQESVEWHRVTLYKRRAEVAGEFLQKGSLVYIEGRLKTRKWTDQQGVDRYTTEIIGNEMKMLSPKQDSNNSGQNSGYQQGNNQRSQGNNQQGGYQQQSGQRPQGNNQNRNQQQNGNGQQTQGNQQQGQGNPPPLTEPDFSFDEDLPFAPLFKQYRGMHYAV